jgi:hypothetical protein
MAADTKAHQIFGDATVFAECRNDKKFAYVVALARAVNALNSAHSLMQCAADKNTPAATRDQWNSYFFVSAILYESLNLIRAMGAVFGKEKIFQDTIQTLLKDKTAQKLEQTHLKATRRDAVFHYLPDRFAEAIAATPLTECLFASFLGQKRSDIRYDFADIIAAEIGVGGRIDNSLVVSEMMEKTLNLAISFINQSEKFIVEKLNGWRFKGVPGGGVAPGNQSSI